MSYEIDMSNWDTSATAVKKAVDLVVKDAKKRDTQAHHAGMLALAHIMEHGNTTPLTRLANNMPRSYRIRGFALWANNHAPLRLYEKDNAWVVKMDKGWKPEDFKLAEANSDPFFKHSKEKDPSARSLDALVSSFFSALEKNSKIDAAKCDPVEAELIANAVKSAREKLSLLKAAAVENAVNTAREAGTLSA